ncbi:MAG TPA: trimethylamine methyltransferase [Desulfobacteraceae bacterium]|nr:trimethylamine methyltransferase [Desulfobacteraceae bacterium]
MSDILKKIHNTSIRILNEIGIRLHHPEIIEMMAEKGIRIDGNTAYFTEKQIYHWLNKAPGRFTVYARNSDYDMFIGGDHTEYASGYGTPTIVDPDGMRRPADMSDFLTFVKLVHQTQEFKLNGGILVQPSDIPAGQSSAIMTYATLTHSDKCLMGIPGTTQEVEQIMEMAAIALGGMENLVKRPHVITMVSTLSPLQIDHIALGTMMVCARLGQPMIISPAPAAGLTGPIVMAGNISLANAEALAGIAIAQMLREGTPVIYGLQSYAADMQSGQISIGSPGYSVQAKYCSQLARMYGLPSRTGGTNTDAKGVSVQSGYEAMMSMLTACQNRVNLIVHSAGILDSYGATSYEQFIVDLEIISMIEAFLADIKDDPEDFAFDVIKEVGIGGQFLTSRQTAERCRTDSWHPFIGLRGHMISNNPNDQILENIGRIKKKMLDGYRTPDMDAGTAAALNNYMTESLNIPTEVLDQIQTSLNPS